MMGQWENGRPLVDAAALAATYNVSQRTVRRRCRPVKHIPHQGNPRGTGGKALYDALNADLELGGGPDVGTPA